MEFDASDSLGADRRSTGDLAQALVRLFGERFGGAATGKFRISRKFLRQLAGRRKLSDAYLAALAEEMFEAGFVFVGCESYFIVLSQKQFASYRRVTAAAVNRVMPREEANDEPKTTRSKASDPTVVRDIEGKTVQKAPEIH